MRKLLIIAITVFASFICHGQMIDNRFSIYFRYGSSGFSGDEILKENSFISPSLFSNLKILKHSSFKGLMKTSGIVSFGLGYEYSEASEWALQGYNDYNNSSIKLYSFSPIIQVHNKLKETGLLNRIRPYIEIAPTAGFSNLTLKTPLFDIQSTGNPVDIPLRSNDIFFGAKGEVGFEFVVTQVIGFTCSYTYNYNSIKSKLYNDTHFSVSQFSLGVFVRCKKNKRYYY